ncbi:MAG TPA: hypothetical protein VFR81_13255 [Longimicrobium sp.]|nr:hypothetical protein [Longimicrobium sp.]
MLINKVSRLILRFLLGAVVSTWVLLNAPQLASQTPQEDDEFERPFSTQDWCADSATACWTDPADRAFFNGVRLVAELDLSFIFQGGQNRFEGGIKNFGKIALEWNLYEGWVSLQTGLIAPGVIQFDNGSPAVQNLREPLRAERKVRFDWGYVLGLSFLDGGISAGMGRFAYDRRDFVNPDSVAAHVLRDRFQYIALQPLSSLRSAIKRDQDR